METKVLHLISSIDRSSAGVGEVLRELVSKLSQYDDLNLKVHSLEHEHTFEDIQKWTVVKPDVYSINFKKLFPYIGFGYSKKLLKESLRVNIDILHNHGLWMFPSYVARSLVKNKNTPLVVSPHGMLDSWALNRSRLKKRLLYKIFEKFNLNNASCIHALCESELDSVRAAGISSPVCLIPNGVKLPEKDEDFGQPVWHGVFGSRKVLLFVGRLHPKKNLINLIKAYGLLKKNDKTFSDDWAIAICGWDQLGHFNEIDQLIMEQSLVNDIVLFGPVFNQLKYACFLSADAFILPSLSEGLPVSVLEAWSFKLPVFMTAECNIPEGFNSHAAIKIGTTPEDLVVGLRALKSLSDYELQTMGERGYELVLKKFTWDSVAEKFYDTYKWILGVSEEPDFIVR